MVTLLIGLSMAVHYSPVKYCPHGHFNLFCTHRITAYATITLTLAHPLVLLFVRRVPFRIVDILLPMRSSLQPWQNTLGAIALYLLVIVLVTSLHRLSIGRKWWKRAHLLVYPAAVLLFIHGVFTDSELKTGRADVLDGEKSL
jgi:sulfoxide reductase heme-binding subunit YedZ